MNSHFRITPGSVEERLKRLILFLIRWYQKILSPDHGIFSYQYPNGFCRYSPSCSEYAKQSILRFGVVRGVGRSLSRVVRCNPFVVGGYDPVDPVHDSWVEPRSPRLIQPSSTRGGLRWIKPPVVRSGQKSFIF